MIGKVIIGSNFGNLCRYALNDPDRTKRPVVLAAAGVRSWSARVMEEDFTDQQLLRPGLGRAVMHVALAWPPEETQRLSDEAMVRFALEYLACLKIDPAATQWALVRHHDQEHPHAHLLINRVTNGGGVLPDAHNFAKSAAACRSVEAEYGLVDAGKLGEQRHRKLVDRHSLGEREAVKLKVRDALDKYEYVPTDVPQLTALLARERVETRPTFRNGKLQAVVFVHADHPELPIKGSEIGRPYSGNNLQKMLDFNNDSREADLADQRQAQQAAQGSHAAPNTRTGGTSVGQEADPERHIPHQKQVARAIVIEARQDEIEM